MTDTDGTLNEDANRRTGRRRVFVRVLLAMAAILVVMQLVPYGWQHSNPQVVRDAPWPDPESRQIARTSCYSCHSNETDWPIYSYVAPMSWLVRYDVDRGRDALNFSEWHSDDAEDAIEMIEEGTMPLDRYTMIHRGARLTDSEGDTLVRALQAMADNDGDSGGGVDDGDDD
jgi:hypothetical protein